MDRREVAATSGVPRKRTRAGGASVADENNLQAGKGCTALFAVVKARTCRNHIIVSSSNDETDARAFTCIFRSIVDVLFSFFWTAPL